MFHMVNPFGNVHKHVQSEVKKNELLKEGWKLVEENDAAIAATPHPSPAATPSPQGEGLNDVAPYNGPQQAEEPQQGATDDTEEGKQTADRLNITEEDTKATATTEDDVDGTTIEDDTKATAEDSTQAVKDPEPATAPAPEPEVKAPKAAKSPKSTTGKSTKGAAKNKKTEE